MKYSIDCIKWKVTILFCGKIVAIVVDAYTNSKLQWLPLTRAVQGFFFSAQTCGLVDVNETLPWFSRIGQEKILFLFLEHSKENVGI